MNCFAMITTVFLLAPTAGVQVDKSSGGPLPDATINVFETKGKRAHIPPTHITPSDGHVELDGSVGNQVVEVEVDKEGWVGQSKDVELRGENVIHFTLEQDTIKGKVAVRIANRQINYSTRTSHLVAEVAVNENGCFHTVYKPVLECSVSSVMQEVPEVQLLQTTSWHDTFGNQMVTQSLVWIPIDQAESLTGLHGLEKRLQNEISRAERRRRRERAKASMP